VHAVPPLMLRDFVPADDAELISWFPTDAELALFSGVHGIWPLTPEKLELRRREPGVRAYSAVLGPSTLAGHVELVDAGAGHVRFARVAIAPGLRGRGLAASLLECAIDEARRLGATKVSLRVVPGNIPALRSYERAGFADAGTDPAVPQFVVMTRAV
jgi:GNAT superfamily N-acetyltransferase